MPSRRILDHDQPDTKQRGTVMNLTVPRSRNSTESWRTEAACRGLDTALFFPDRGESLTEARAVCASCPVSGACAEHAIRQSERYGVWGGTSGRQRRRTPHINDNPRQTRSTQAVAS